LVDRVTNIVLGHWSWCGETDDRAHVEGDGGWRERRRIDVAEYFSPGMAELGPEMRAGRRAGAGQPRQLFLSAVIMDHDVERAF
jgi:hypothetical protein